MGDKWYNTGLIDVFSSEPAEKAAEQQAKSDQAAIEEQRRQFDAFQALLQPYTQAGNPALKLQMSMLGLGDNAAPKAQIKSILEGPQYQSMLQQGEQSILQNASATGGLRGGNTQGALAQFSPQLLSQLLNERFSQLGAMTQLGQNSAAGIGNQGMAMAGNIGNLYRDIGAANASKELASQQQMSNLLGLGATFGGAYLGSRG